MDSGFGFNEKGHSWKMMARCMLQQDKRDHMISSKCAQVKKQATDQVKYQANDEGGSDQTYCIGAGPKLKRPVI